MFAQIIPATRTGTSASAEFSYAVPDILNDKIRPGQIVEIPWGDKKILGAVRSVGDSVSSGFAVKDISALSVEEPIFTPQLFALAEFMAREYYTSLGLVVKSLMAKPAKRAKKIERQRAARQAKKIILNDRQTQAASKLSDSLNKAGTFLLHGVTGSGKTEVYLDVVERVVRSGGQCLILVPEIVLTPQTLSRFEQRFDPGIVEVVHSKISYGQKFLIWQNIFRNKTKILIGPRSALFAPFAKLGLIVIDEEHDSSFKQFEQQPLYHARKVAEYLSSLWSCPLLLSDATPSLESYFVAKQGQYELLELPERALQEMPQVDLVDMRDESRSGNFTIFSENLVNKINKNLLEKKQIILFINRRGMATSQVCRDCGTLAMCKGCEVPLVYHHSEKKLACHHCGRRYEVPISCPKCGSHRLKLQGTGTEKVELQIKELAPTAKVRRLDRDIITKKSEMEALYHDFLSEKFDILVGTQMIAKGWDLSRVGLIGVINADTILNLPDFRSNERTFQLITQVSGRAGRSHFPGQVVLQTFSPDNFALKFATKHDYKSFYAREVEHRRQFFYPPWSTLIKLTTKAAKQELGIEKGVKLVDSLRPFQEKGVFEILGPAPAFIPRVRGRHIVYVIIKLNPKNLHAKKQDELTAIFQNLPSGWEIDVQPDTLL